MDKRFIVSATIDGKEVVRPAVYAKDAREVASMDVFEDDEFAMLTDGLGTQTINVVIKEDVETG